MTVPPFSHRNSYSILITTLGTAILLAAAVFAATVTNPASLPGTDASPGLSLDAADTITPLGDGTDVGEVVTTNTTTSAPTGGGSSGGGSSGGPSNVLPIACFTQVDSGLSTDVDASCSTDSDGILTSYAWDWGDGSTTMSGSTTTHNYTEPGQYTLGLTVTDSVGATASTEQTLLIGRPVACFTAPITSMTLDADATCSTATPPAIVASYTWDWGDGSTVETFAANASANHTYETRGLFVINLTVADDSDPALSASTERNVSFDLLACFSHFENGLGTSVDASCSLDPFGSIVSYAWDWGDGTNDTLAAANTFHTYLVEGTYNVSLTVTNDAAVPETNVTSRNITADDQGVPLRSLGTFAIIAGSTVTSTGPTTVNGDIGISPGTKMTGFGPGTHNGEFYTDGPVSQQAKTDLTAAYNDAAGRSDAPVVLTESFNLGGKTFGPGLYKSASSLQITGSDFVLDAGGDANATFIFQMGSTFTVGNGLAITLVNGAEANRIYWQVGSSATFGTMSAIKGNFLVDVSITAETGAVVDGRLLTGSGAVSLDANDVSVPS